MTGSGDWMLAAFLVFVGFGALAILGYLLMQVIQLDAAFRFNRGQCLQQIRQLAKQLRETRMSMQKVDASLAHLPKGLFSKGKWKVAYWVFKLVMASQKTHQKSCAAR